MKEGQLQTAMLAQLESALDLAEQLKEPVAAYLIERAIERCGATCSQARRRRNAPDSTNEPVLSLVDNSTASDFDSWPTESSNHNTIPAQHPAPSNRYSVRLSQAVVIAS